MRFTAATLVVALAIGLAAGLGGYTFAARKRQRTAQFYLDFVEAENSTGFHAPEEALRILGESIDFARQGQLALRPLPPRR